MRRQTNIIREVDWLTVLLYATLVLAGWINIYAAVYDEQHASIFSFSQRYGKQLIWMIAAMALAVILLLLDTQFYPMVAYPVYICCILALAAVLVPGIGREVNDARSWFSFGGAQLPSGEISGGLQVQPSEFAKIAVSLALAKFLGNASGKLMDLKNIAVAGAIIFLPPAFIILQPDAGSCLVYLAFFLVLYREGLPPSILLFGVLAVILFILSLLMQNAQAWLICGLVVAGFVVFWLRIRQGKNFLKGLGVFVSLSALFWGINYLIGKRFEIHELLLGAALVSALVFVVVSFIIRMPFMRTLTLFIAGALLFTASVDFVFNEVLSSHHQKRILVTIGMESDPQGIEYNVNQSKIAIGSGGIMGKGFLQGTQTKYKFVPEQSTDFIFCTVGEEWGFAGTSVVVGLFVWLLLRLLYLAERQRSVFSRVYAYCVLSIFFLHITINIGMTVDLLPVIGIPLPFFSYGGSSLWAFTILLFILLRLDASREEYVR